MENMLIKDRGLGLGLMEISYIIGEGKIVCRGFEDEGSPLFEDFRTSFLSSKPTISLTVSTKEQVNSLTKSMQTPVHSPPSVLQSFIYLSQQDMWLMCWEVSDKLYNQIQRQSMSISGSFPPLSTGASLAGEDGEVAGFILKTFQILRVEQYQKVIYWATNGLEFIIKDIEKLEEIVLPRYFRHNKMNSFVRQLNMYGFHKIKHNNFKSTFRHQYFQKDREELLPLIRRKPKLNDKEGEENACEEAQMAPAQPQRPAFIQGKQEEHSTMCSDKWANITQQFLATTKMINLSLVKVTFNELSEISNIFAEQQDDCVSIEDQMQTESKQNPSSFSTFQNPTFFFSSQFDL